MPVKSLSDRANWGFGELLNWHVLERGTRPKGKERIWKKNEFAGAAGYQSGNSLTFWIAEDHLPPTVDDIEKALLGAETSDDLHAEFRQELRRKFEKARESHTPKARDNVHKPTSREIAGEPLGAPSAAFSEEKGPNNNIWIAVPKHLVGRQMFDSIAAGLKKNEGRRAIVALYGLPGVGKTTLAIAYAEDRNASYRAIWQIGAQTELSMRTDMVELGKRLGWVGAQEKEHIALTAVKDRLRREGKGILLIYDNAIDVKMLEPYLPIGGAAQIIVTSNNHDWHKIAEPIEVSIWPKEVGADFLIARSGRDDPRVAAQALSEALGGLALAHEMAAAFCGRRETSLSEYKKRFDASPVKYLGNTRDAPSEYGLTVAKTLELAIEAASELHPAAEHLIVYAALLASEPIPLFLFSEAREKFGEPLASMLADDGLEEAVAALRAFALVNRVTVESEIAAIQLHRLVHEVAAARREDEAQSRFNTLVMALAAVYPASGYDNSALWPRCAVLTSHVSEILTSHGLEIQFSEMSDAAPWVERSQLGNSVIGYLVAIADSTEDR